SALNLDNKLLLRTLVPALVLAGPGLLLSAAIVGGFLSWLTPLSVGECTAFGTLIAATDPVAVIALFKELCVPEGLTMLVEGESMLNDATAIVLFELVMAVVASEGVEAVTALERAPLNVFAVLGGGVLTGGIIAAVMEYSAALAKKRLLDSGYCLCDYCLCCFPGCRTLLACFWLDCCIDSRVSGGRASDFRLSREFRTYLHDFWDHAAFIANSLIFLLLGLTTAGFINQFDSSTPRLWSSIAWAVVAALLARGVVVFTLTP
ncbi:MAG: transporter, partial [Cyanobacteria bacterium QS_7_48_42]